MKCGHEARVAPAFGRGVGATCFTRWKARDTALALVITANEIAAGRITFAEISSAALGRNLPVAIVAPEKPQVAVAAPVLFILHGRGRHHRSLLDAPAAREALLAAPFHIDLPQGEEGWYVDSPAIPGDRYASYLDEVVAWAEEALPVARGPEKRGIAGWSMGGFGAMRFAESRPRRFGFVASMIGLLDFPRPETLPEGQNYRVPVARFTADPEIRLDGGHEFPLVERALPLVIAEAGEHFKGNAK